MKILIVGLGYAGSRFMKAAESIKLSDSAYSAISLAYVEPSKKNVSIPYYYNIKNALLEYQPDILINASNDVYHLDVIKDLTYFKGFLLNEKPLITPFQDIDTVSRSLKNISGFTMDMVERYSDATEALKKYIYENSLVPVRISFIWGKNRLEDHRPTCGVGSEIIHALDLMEYIIPNNSSVTIHSAIGIVSDFSVSGSEILDTVHFTAQYINAAVDGYASFVNIDRQRNIDFTFNKPNNNLIYARIVYDTPDWDIDTLTIWERDDTGLVRILYKLETKDNQAVQYANGLYKITAILKEAINYSRQNRQMINKFCSLDQSIKLYNHINQIYALANKSPVARYHSKGRRTVSDNANSETLG